MLATYHNHSTWSDGVAPLPLVVARARELGVEELGMSDHYVLHPSGEFPRWSMDPAYLGTYVDDVLAQQDEPGPTVRLGLEVDYFPGHEEAIRAALAPFPFDYLIGSVHSVDGFRIDSTPRAWATLDEDKQNEMHRRYWRYKAKLAESGLFDVVAHLDLSKKFGHRPTVDITDEIEATLDAIAEARLVVELNTAGWHRPCEDAYPTLEILKGCCRRGIRTTLSADAHEPDHLMRDFDRGRQRLAEAGYAEIARFVNREVRMEPL